MKRMPHLDCLDPWYSCPLSNDPPYCINHNEVQDKCTCGADEINAYIELLENQLIRAGWSLPE